MVSWGKKLKLELGEKMNKGKEKRMKMTLKNNIYIPGKILKLLQGSGQFYRQREKNTYPNFD